MHQLQYVISVVMKDIVCLNLLLKHIYEIGGKARVTYIHFLQKKFPSTNHIATCHYKEELFGHIRRVIWMVLAPKTLGGLL